MYSKALLRGAMLASCSILISQPAFAQDTNEADDSDTVLTDTIVVTAALPATASADVLTQPEQIAMAADTAAIAARTPGGALVGNGALSGQLSYRGLAGQRVFGRVNGQRFASGGPNVMDPPLHYAPSVLVERIEIARGVAPVSSGPSLAGAVNAQLGETQFTDSETLSP